MRAMRSRRHDRVLAGGQTSDRSPGCRNRSNPTLLASMRSSPAARRSRSEVPASTACVGLAYLGIAAVLAVVVGSVLISVALILAIAGASIAVGEIVNYGGQSHRIGQSWPQLRAHRRGWGGTVAAA